MTAFGLPSHMVRQRKPSSKPRQHPEQDLQMSVAAWFRRHIDRKRMPWTAIGHGVYLTRNQEEARRRGKKLKDMGVNPGWSDFHWVWNKRPFYMEIKSETGVLSPAQKEFRDDMTAAGGVVLTCRTLQEVIDFMRVIEAPFRS